jgi:Raf kinase inhibitor-like YbhB/YbcL family protein
LLKNILSVAGMLLIFHTHAFSSELSISSESIKDGKIEKIHACGRQGGRDMPLQLSIKGIPGEAKYLAIVSDDPDAVRPAGRVWVHWNIFNVPVKGDGLDIAAGEKLEGDLGRTSGNSKGYEGMCPPDGVHTYRFAVFALSGKIELGGFFGPNAMTIDAFEGKYKASIVRKGIITGKF